MYITIVIICNTRNNNVIFVYLSVCLSGYLSIYLSLPLSYTDTILVQRASSCMLIGERVCKLAIVGQSQGDSGLGLEDVMTRSSRTESLLILAHCL